MVFLQETASKDNADAPSADIYTRALFASQYTVQCLPRNKMPENDMPADAAYQFIKQELALDGNPILNLASFVTTYMEPEAEKLIAENMSKNFIDAEEYPMTADIQNRCVNMIADLFHAPSSSEESGVGVSTIGSSEAIILSTLAMKRRWQLKRKEKGLPTDKPNLVMGSNVQVCWEKAVRYLEIEARYVNCDQDHFFLNPEKAMNYVDENTIGVVVILGSTYTGHYEDAKAMNDLLLEYKERTEQEVPIHVDAASGGFVAPFVVPDLEWDFRLPTVCSINVSGHKYGLVYPGVGWSVWRSKEYLPEDLVFHMNYLGADQATFTLNFSKGASQVIAQYYILIRLGKAGFKAIMRNLHTNARYLTEQLEATGYWEILSANDPAHGLPLVAFKLKKRHRFDEFNVSHTLRERQWVVPAYTMAPDAQNIKLLRVVLREDFTRNRCDLLIRDIKAAVEHLCQVDENSLKSTRNARNRWQQAIEAIPKKNQQNGTGADSGPVC